VSWLFILVPRFRFKDYISRQGRSIEIGSEICFCKGGLPLVYSLTACFEDHERYGWQWL